GTLARAAAPVYPNAELSRSCPRARLCGGREPDARGMGGPPVAAVTSAGNGHGTGDGGPAILVAEDVHLRFGGVVALAGVSLSVGRGEIFAIVGPNGAGKT